MRELIYPQYRWRIVRKTPNMSRTFGKIPKVETTSSIQQPTINMRSTPLRKAGPVGVSQHQVQHQPHVQQTQQLNQQQFDEGQIFPEPQDDKIPLFLVKLWNIIEDPQYQQIVHWDESGTSFHIADPYSFCRNVLPHYFKHNNLNSLIRQLNMYGFRKMTPITQSGLTRTESDQDHLEFQHPCFVQNRPDMLANIKRKQSQRVQDDKTTHSTQLDTVMTELRTLRERHKALEVRMTDVTKQNATMYEQLERLRQQHQKQHIVVGKLVQFMISVMQPTVGKRSLKRNGHQLVAIDDCISPSKKFRPEGSGSSTSGSAGQPSHAMLFDILEYLNGETNKQGPGVFKKRLIDNGPLIADVTDEMNLDGFEEVEGVYAGDHHNQSSPGASSSARRRFSNDGPPSNNTSSRPPLRQTTAVTSNPRSYEEQSTRQVTNQRNLAPSPDSYIGSGVYVPQIKAPVVNQNNSIRAAPAPQRYTNTRRQLAAPSMAVTMADGRNTVQQPFVTSPASSSPGKSPMVSSQSNGSNLTDFTHGYEDEKSTMTNALVSALPSSQLGNQGTETFSPSIGMSPSLDRQISNELQDYLNGVDFSIDNCRELLAGADWGTAFDGLDDLEDSTNQAYSNGQQLALEQPERRPELEYYPQEQPLTLNDGEVSNDGLHDTFGNFETYPGQEDQFLSTPHFQDYVSPDPSPSNGAGIQ